MYGICWAGLSALLLLLSICALPLHGDDDPPIPLFGRDYWIERGAVALLGAPGPLQQAAFLPVGEWLRLWDVSAPNLRDESRTPAGAAVLVSAVPGQGPLAVPLILQAGEAAGCWSLSNPFGVRRLDDNLLRQIVRDDSRLPGPNDGSPESGFERQLVQDALLKVLRSPDSEFERVARLNVIVEDLE